MFFMTSWQRKMFGEHKSLFLDGNFKIHPQGYKQIVTLMARNDNFDFGYPLLFVLLTDKRTESYIEIFREIKDLIDQNGCKLKNYSLTIDFEPSLLKAAKKELPNIKLIGCGFHFIQRLKLKLNNRSLLFEDSWFFLKSSYINTWMKK